MKKLIAGIGIATFSTLLSAQQAFDGFNFQLGLGVTQSQVKASGTEDSSWGTVWPTITNPSIDGKSTGTSFNGFTSIGYSQSFNNLFNGFNLAANVFYVIGNQSAGNLSNSAKAPTETETLSGSYKVKNTWGISVEPGYYINKNLLGYLKFAYVSTSASLGTTCYSSESYCYGLDRTQSMNVATTTNKTLNGIGYGAGSKYLITKDVYAAVDFLYIDYSKINQSFSWTGYSTSNGSFKAQQLMGFVSIGYKF